MKEGRTFSDFSYEKPETGESRETLMKLDVETLKGMRDKLEDKVKQYGSSRPVRYAKSGNTDVLGQQSAPAMDDKRQDRSYLDIIKSVIAEKESKNESKKFKHLKTFESFGKDEECECGNYSEDGECECGDMNSDSDDKKKAEELNEGRFLRGAMKGGFAFFGVIKSLISALKFDFKKLVNIWKGMPTVYKIIDIFDFMKYMIENFDEQGVEFEDFVLSLPLDYPVEFSSISTRPTDADYMRATFLYEYKRMFNRDLITDINKVEKDINESIEKKRKEGSLSAKDYKTQKQGKELVENISKIVNIDEGREMQVKTVGELKDKSSQQQWNESVDRRSAFQRKLDDLSKRR